MATFTAENRESWNALFASVGAQRPSKGKRVRVVQGRTHRDTTGIVTWHGEDRYWMAEQRRYMSDAQLALNEARGRDGWRCRIAPDDGSAPFFVSAAYAEVITDACENPNS